MADPPGLQQVDALALGNSLVIVGGECRTDERPCDAVTSTFAVLNPPYDRWEGRTRGGRVSAEVFSVGRIGSTNDEAYFGVGIDLWAIRRDGRLRVTRNPEALETMCLSDGGVVALTYDHRALRFRDGEWEPLAGPPDRALLDVERAHPVCVGDGVALTTEDGRSVHLAGRVATWVAAAGSAPRLPHARRSLVDGFGGRFVVADGRLHAFSATAGWQQPTTSIDWSRPITAAELEGRMLVAGDGIMTLVDVA